MCPPHTPEDMSHDHSISSAVLVKARQYHNDLSDYGFNIQTVVLVGWFTLKGTFSTKKAKLCLGQFKIDDMS